MADYTENLNLILPKTSEKYDVEVANTNNKIIDVQIENKVSKIVGKGLSTNDFTNEYKKKVDSLQTLYRFKGNVATLVELNSKTDNNVGDVWKCLEDSNNYCWNNQEWVNIGTDIDLSEYALQSEVDSEFNEMDSKKANKIEIEQHRYKTTLEADLADNSELTLPAYYKVGTDSLQVYFEGCLLEKGVHYLEVGTDNSISNKIQINNWGEAVKEGYTFAFLIQGSYTEVVSDE